MYMDCCFPFYAHSAQRSQFKPFDLHLSNSLHSLNSELTNCKIYIRSYLSTQTIFYTYTSVTYDYYSSLQLTC